MSFYSRRSGKAEIFWRPADASAEAELLSSSEYPRFPHSWTPDGESFVFVEIHPDTGNDIWTRSMDGDATETPVLQTESTEDWPTISPDGRWMAYQSDESGRREIYLRPLRSIRRRPERRAIRDGRYERLPKTAHAADPRPELGRRAEAARPDGELTAANVRARR